MISEVKSCRFFSNKTVDLKYANSSNYLKSKKLHTYQKNLS